MAGDRSDTLARFHEAVNMSAEELEAWLKTAQSRAVGQKKEGARESVGHASGRLIVSLLRTSEVDLGEDDYQHMRKVAGFVRRHLAQRPSKIVTSRWRYSLMNWGHDPLKD